MDGLCVQKGKGTPQEDQQSQPCSQRLNHQPKSIHRVDLDLPHICSRYAAWSSCGSQTNEVGAIPKAVACMWDMVFYLGCLVLERMSLIWQRLDAPGSGDTLGSHSLRGEGEER